MANNILADPNCKALWKMNTNGVTIDAKGTNTLTDGNTVVNDTANFREGNASADFERANSEYLSILDSALDAGFPLKSGDTNKIFSICMWIRPESFPGTGADWELFDKTEWNSNKKSVQIGLLNTAGNTTTYLCLGYNAGVSFETKAHTATLSLATWYHITYSYDNTDKSYAIRVKDEFGETVGTDLTHLINPFTLDANKLNVEDAILSIGCLYTTSTTRTNYYDGLIDELAVFNDVITAEEATQIAKGHYMSVSTGVNLNPRNQSIFATLNKGVM